MMLVLVMGVVVGHVRVVGEVSVDVGRLGI